MAKMDLNCTKNGPNHNSIETVNQNRLKLPENGHELEKWTLIKLLKWIKMDLNCTKNGPQFLLKVKMDVH